MSAVPPANHTLGFFFHFLLLYSRFPFLIFASSLPTVSRETWRKPSLGLSSNPTTLPLPLKSVHEATICPRECCEICLCISGTREQTNGAEPFALTTPCLHQPLAWGGCSPDQSADQYLLRSDECKDASQSFNHRLYHHIKPRKGGS